MELSMSVLFSRATVQSIVEFKLRVELLHALLDRAKQSGALSVRLEMVLKMSSRDMVRSSQCTFKQIV